MQNQNHLVTNVILLTYWCYPQGEKGVFLECVCKKNLYYFLLNGMLFFFFPVSEMLFNTMLKVFNLLISALEWEFGLLKRTHWTLKKN